MRKKGNIIIIEGPQGSGKSTMTNFIRDNLPGSNLYRLSGSPATASDNMRTQEYTAVICMEERSVTILPLEELPQKK